MLKNTGVKPDERIHNVRSGGALSLGASVPLELKYVMLPVCGDAHQPGNVSKPCT